MAEHVPGIWETEVAAYDAGQMGSRRLMELEMALVDVPEAELLATAAAQPHDPGFVPFVRRAQAAGVPIEIVSDGFGFFIEPALEALGVGELPVVTARTTFRRPARLDRVPERPPARASCAGRASGTGCSPTRRPAARSSSSATARATGTRPGYSDVVWAKRSLVRICVEAGWAFQRWTEFREIEAWLAETLAAWRADPGSLGPPARHPFFCGPEVWGEGLIDPPPGNWPPPD